MLIQYKVLILLAVLAGSAFGGWTARGWKDDSRQLAVARQEQADVARQQAEYVAATRATLAKLDKMKPTQREIRHEIERIEYRDRQCLDVRAVELLNADAQNIAAAPPPDTLPGQPATVE